MNGKIVITDSGKFEEVILKLEESYKKITDTFAKEKTNKEEINAKNEIRKTAVPEGMDDIVKAAKANLVALREQLNEMEVQHDN